MATGTSNLNSPPPAPAAEPQFDAVVERQLREARLQVKLTDIAATMMIWLAGVIVFLLFAAIIDSYIFDLGVAGRIVALTVLVGASLWYFIATLLPMVTGRINPVYVASIIEESQPSLKNSLMNFLLLRGDPRGVHNAIFSALRQQAAAGVSQVNVSAAVDRSKIITTGYVLAAAVAIFAIYTVLQPNPLAPLETMRRIFAPLSAIERPTRVQITNIQPGDVSVFRGEHQLVSAVVHHLAEDQPVTLVYSTVDGVTVDRAVEMQLDEKSGEHRVLLDNAGEGLQQTLVYRIEAGDAVSPSHQLTVIDRPAIWVQSLEYDYPPQTGMKPRTEAPPANGGDIAGIEGTHVTIRATANMEIASAYLEFDPATGSTPRKLPMQHEGKTASVKLPLQMNSKRDGPLYSSYTVRFTPVGGKRSKIAAEPHQIEVTPDVAPEVEILHPVANPHKLQANGSVEIEIRAVDVDFGLRKISLQAELIRRDGKDTTPETDTRARKGGLLNKVLFEHPSGVNGKQIATHRFEAATLRLQPGDLVRYRAVAFDNRTDPVDRRAAPNEASTSDFLIQITAATASDDAASDGSSSKTDTPADPSDGSPSGDTSETGSEADSKDPGDESKDPGSSENPEDGDSADSEGGTSDSESSDGDAGGSESADSESAGGESSKGESSDGATGSESSDGSDGQSGDKSQDSQPAAGGAGSESEEPGDSASQAADQDGGSGSTSKGSNAGDSKSPQGDDAAPGGEGQSTGNPADGSTGGSPESGSAKGDPQGDGEADSPQDPLHDGEVFERALEHMKQQQKKNGGSGTQPEGDGSTPPPGSQSDQQEDGGASGDTASQDSTGKSPQPGQGEKSDQGAQQQPPADGAQNDAATGDSESGADPGTGEKQDPQGKPGQKPQDGGADSQGSGDKKGGMDPQDGAGSPQGEGEKPGKKDGSNDSGSKPGSDGQSASQSQKASSTKGDDGGDRSGAGQKGGGQGSDNPGQGKAGGSTPSDTGAGAANETGDGETGDQAGGDKPGQASDGDGAGTDTGGKQPGGDQPGQNPGDTPGQGKTPTDTRQESQDETQQPVDEQKPAKPDQSTDSPENTPSGKSGESTPPGNPGSKPSETGGAGSPFGGSGGMADTPIGENVENSNMPPGDKANLEYARKATDLALEHLRKNSRKPDKELLDKLNMSPEELQAFVDRWQKMKSSAAEDGKAGSAELDDSLRSLGLTPSTGKARSAGARDDAIKGVRDAGSRTAPPPGFLKKFKAFQKGVARGE